MESVWKGTRVRKKIVIGGIALALIAGTVWGIQAQKGPSIRYSTVPIERGTVVSKVTATGTLSALVTVQVGSQVSGRLQQILVDFNSPVKKGQVLAKLDPQLFQATLEQARARHLAAKSDLARSQVEASLSKRQLERTKLLAERRLIATSDLDSARAAYEVAQAQVMAQEANLAQARASLQQAEVNLGYTTIVSPINGVVIARNVDVGQTVAASLQAPTLFLIAQDLRKVQVVSSVAEADISKLSPNMEAEFTVDAYPTETFKGKVHQIRNSPQTTQNVVTYDALINVDNPELKLKPGMTANVTFVCDRRDDALRVPNAALRFRPTFDGEKRVRGENRNNRDNRDHRERRKDGKDGKRGPRVWVLKDGKPRPVRLETGLTDGSYTEVVKGIEEGTEIIVDSGEKNQKSQQRGSNQGPRMRGLL